jgi:hypothetical protein
MGILPTTGWDYGYFFMNVAIGDPPDMLTAANG